jgi:hypothetical protein
VRDVILDARPYAFLRRSFSFFGNHPFPLLAKGKFGMVHSGQKTPLQIRRAVRHAWWLKMTKTARFGPKTPVSAAFCN